MRQKRAYMYRFCPTPEQVTALARTFGCARFVYNWALSLRTDAYYQRQERISYADTSAALTVLKRGPATAWLNEVSSVPPQQALRHLDRAFRNFFEGRARYPAFKKKRGHQAFRWEAEKRSLTLAKMDAPLAIVWSRVFTGAPTTVTVTRDPGGRYFVSFLVEEEVTPLPPADAAIGLDMGVSALVTLSTGEKITNPKHQALSQRRIRKAQKNLARKQKGSRNREQARQKVARAHARIADQRLDGLHKLSTRLIRENQTVCVETLAVQHLVRNRRLAQAISDASWSELIRQLEYKAAWYGRTLVKIDKWYPSSKRCCDCGHVFDSLPLSVRQWTCPACGVLHDRDVNAAKNVLAVERHGHAWQAHIWRKRRLPSHTFWRLNWSGKIRHALRKNPASSHRRVAVQRLR
jgi:putative transposase